MVQALGSRIWHIGRGGCRLNLAGVMVQSASSEHPTVAGCLMVASGLPKRVHEFGKDCSSFIMPEPRIWHHVLSCLLYFIGERRPRSTCIQEGGDIGNLPSMGCVGVKKRATIFNRPHSSFILEDM